MHHMTCSVAHETRIMVGMTTPERPAPIVTSARCGIAVSAEALLSRMRQTAAYELAMHLPTGTQCGCCGENWPCGRARQADLALS